METKFGIQLPHGKCYFYTEPGCSRTANNMKQSLPAFVEFIGCKLLQLNFYHSKVRNPEWRGLRPVYSSMLRNSVYRASRVLSWGQNYRFCTVKVEIWHHAM